MATPRTEHIPIGLKIAFGAPTFAGAAMAIPIAIHLTKFYVDVVIVPLGFLGVVIALARAFDALTDPLMGWVSDRTRTRWGRRRPYLAIGAPLCALAFWALFSPPASLTETGALVWFGATFALYYLFHTVYLIPHFALGPELSLDYHERSTPCARPSWCSGPCARRWFRAFSAKRWATSARPSRSSRGSSADS